MLKVLPQVGLSLQSWRFGYIMKKLFFLSLPAISFYFITITAIYAQDKDETLTVYFVERIPYFYTDGNGNFRGIVTDRVKLVFEKAGIFYKFKPLPVKRHMMYLKDNKSKFCTIGWYKNEERLKIAKYSEHIYQNKTRIALAAADNDKIESGHTVDDIFQNRKLILLLREGYSYGNFIDGKIREHNPVRVKKLYTADHMIKIILSQRADYYFTSEEEADALIPKAGFVKEDFKYVRFSNMPTGLKRYILYSRKVEDDLIKKVDETIRKYIH